jgi:hypothetical protein
MTAFWDIAPCSLVEVDRRFRSAYCLHHQGERPDTRRYIPEDSDLHARRRENLKSHAVRCFANQLIIHVPSLKG